MRFSGVSALAIWNNATRTLTGFGVGAMAAGVIVNTSLAGSATVDFRPALNKVVLLSVAILTPAAGGATINISDGTNNAITTTIGASATGFIADSVGAQTATGAVGIRITNTTVNAATYWAASCTLAQ